MGRLGEKMVRFLFFISLCGLVVCGGCNLIAIFGSPTYSEQKVAAEFKLKDRMSDGILVFVETAGGSNVSAEMQTSLGRVIEKFLVEKAKIKSKYIVPSSTISSLQAEKGDFSELSPVEVGRACGAGVVLYVLIEDYNLYEMSGRGYYSGSLISRVVLFDTAAEEVLWPEVKDGRVVGAKVELETEGRAETVSRLLMAVGHCIVRNFYDCPRIKYKIRDEHSYYDADKWE